MGCWKNLCRAEDRNSILLGRRNIVKAFCPGDSSKDKDITNFPKLNPEDLNYEIVLSIFVRQKGISVSGKY